MATGHDPKRPVGRGNPPRETQFKPGQSGNARGRRSKEASLVALVEAEFERELRLRGEDGQVEKVTAKAALARTLVNSAIKGERDARAHVVKMTGMREGGPGNAKLQAELDKYKEKERAAAEFAPKLRKALQAYEGISVVASVVGIAVADESGDLRLSEFGLAIDQFIRRDGSEAQVAEWRQQLLAAADEARAKRLLRARGGPDAPK